ncbi:MAG: hypothetical protein M3Q10_07910 [Chloroflexota bacterium]|nr:hypothetical protein [Chloroflexota bacterium]
MTKTKNDAEPTDPHPAAIAALDDPDARAAIESERAEAEAAPVTAGPTLEEPFPGAAA